MKAIGAAMKWFKTRSRSRQHVRRETAQRPRAERYPLRTAVQLRTPAEPRWRHGVTENVSCTGMLVVSPVPLAPNTPVQVEMQAPSPLCGDATIPMVCDGRVVRSVPDPADRRRVRVAISVASVRLPAGTDAVERMSSDGRPVRELVEELNRHLAIVVGNADLLLSSDAVVPAVASRLGEMKRAALLAASTIRKLPTG